ncbi:unnamed protein product, partial [Polarella glacialis]
AVETILEAALTGADDEAPLTVRETSQEAVTNSEAGGLGAECSGAPTGPVEGAGNERLGADDEGFLYEDQYREARSLEHAASDADADAARAGSKVEAPLIPTEQGPQEDHARHNEDDYEDDFSADSQGQASDGDHHAVALGVHQGQVGLGAENRGQSPAVPEPGGPG